MLVRDMFFSCLRRWYLVVLGLIITSVATYLVFTTVSPTYEAEGSIVLLPPSVAVTVGDNPYLYLGGLDQALGVLKVKVVSPEIAGPLEEQFPGAGITIGKDDTTSGPILIVSVTSEDPDKTLELLEDAMTLVGTTLESLQAEQDVPATSLITAMTLSTDLKPVIVAKRVIQMSVIAAVGGLGATLVLTGLIDRLMSRRKDEQRRNQENAPTVSSAPTQVTGAEQETEARQANDRDLPARVAGDRSERPAERRSIPEEDTGIVSTSANAGI